MTEYELRASLVAFILERRENSFTTLSLEQENLELFFSDDELWFTVVWKRET